ncbi:hypothetical protein [Mangrovicoccus sp. HB161399]|uniref:hypothetical protein n=1 Tax=Mangrovicoccus sp. HB161399 TaxID=2720392 RepID=UPI00352E9362
MAAALRKLAAARQEDGRKQPEQLIEFTMLSNEVAAACGSIMVSSEEFSVPVQSIGQTAGDFRSVSRDMRGSATEACHQMAEADGATGRSMEAMRAALAMSGRLARASGNIAKAVKQIGPIAMLTNLLASNDSLGAAAQAMPGTGFRSSPRRSGHCRNRPGPRRRRSAGRSQASTPRSRPSPGASAMPRARPKWRRRTSQCSTACSASTTACRASPAR